MNSKFKIVIIALLLVYSFSANAQYDKMKGVGIHILGWDYYGFLKGGKHFFVKEPRNAVDSNLVSRLKWTPGIRFSYWTAISRKFDFNTNLNMASLEYPNSDSTLNSDNRFVGDLDLRFSFNFIGRLDHFINPYIFAGFSPAYQYKSGFGFQFPMGLGFNFNVSKERDIALQLESAYKLNLTSHTNTHLEHSLGFVYYWNSNKEKEPEVPVVIDTDGDGIPDGSDKCPTVAGLAKFDGCPDTDGDGIPDELDKCPSTPGVAEYDGCPIPDTDGDGILDPNDKCPTVPGLARYDGCPIPDTDADGFNDEVDKCPRINSTTNNGCPVIDQAVIDRINKAAAAIYFETGKAILKKESYDDLDLIADELTLDKGLYCDIKGYTDNTGRPERNVELSDQRAKVCYDYLVSKGIDPSRLTYKGYGDADPVAENKTAAGRAKNRRTEFTLRNF